MAINRAADRIMWLYFIFIMTSGLLVSGLAFAQDQTLKNIPVLEAKSDINGVDIASGSYVISAPFQFNAPGAGHLNTRTSFNGRKLSFDLNIYLDDQTFTRWDTGNPVERHIRVHLGGVDKLFTCFASGPCTQIVRNDGAVLNRTSTHKYVLTDSDGTIYSFFDLAYQPLPVCMEFGCNNAGYNAYAYVSSVVYPRGEKLTYEPYTVKQTGADYRALDTIRSNLGYRIVLSRVVAANFTPSSNPGTNWLFYRAGGGFDTLITLHSGQAVVGSIATTLTYSNAYLDAMLLQSDDLGRQYRVDLHADLVKTCVADDYTFLLPRTVTSPGGMRTDVTYLDMSNTNYGRTSVPVTSVTRGGLTWLYDIQVSDKRYVTKPLGGTYAFTVAGMSDGYDYGESCSGGSGDVVTKIVDSVDPLNRETEYAYDYANFGKPTKVTMPEDNEYRYDYDLRGNLTTITQLPKPNSGLSSAVIYKADYDTTCVYPVKCNKPNWTKDAKGLQQGYQTDYIYDLVHGGVTSETLPAANGVRPQTRYLYESFDTGDGLLYRLTQSSTCATGAAPACIGTADETRTTYSYTSSNLQPTSVTVAAGNGSLSATTTKTYDSVGNVISLDGPLAGAADTTTYRYDVLHRPVGEVGPAFVNDQGQTRHKARRTTYHLNGQVELVEQGIVLGRSDADWSGFAMLDKTVSTFDSLERVIKVSRFGATGGAYAVTQFSYDALDRKICTAVRMNPDAFGAQPDACVPGTPGADGPDRITYTDYDAIDRIKKVTRGYGVSPQVDKEVVAYTGNGQEQVVADGNGNRTTYEYDGFDRLIKVRYPNAVCCASSTADFEEYGYDVNGNRTSWRRRFETSPVIFTYDALNRATSGLRGEAYGYDNLGRRTSATYAGGVAGTAYDALGRMKSETTNSRVMAYEYDLAGNRTRMTWPDSFAAVYDRDVFGAITAVKEVQTPGATPATLATYSYDDQGRTKSLGRGNGLTTSYGYDVASRLTCLSHTVACPSAGGTWTFAYNAASQVKTRTANDARYEWSGAHTSKTYETNGLNQYAKVGAMAYRYGGRGNLTCDAFNATSGLCEGTGYSYDIVNNLTNVAAGGAATALSYEPTGRLELVSGASATGLLYSGPDLVAEYDGGGALVRRYVPGQGIDAPIVWYEGAGVGDRRWLLADPQGSIVAATNGSGAAIITNTYDEYGVPGPSNQGRFQYTGQIWLPEVGLYHYKARAYSPTLGRFLQTDPTGYDDGLNWYAYVGNDPLNNADPDGKQTLPNSVYDRYNENRQACGGDLGCMRAVNRQQDIEGAKMVGTATITSVATELVAAKVIAVVGRALGFGKTAATVGEEATIAGRTTRQGEDAVRVTRPDGSIVDISPRRVKEFVPNTHPKAPEGAMSKVKFEDALPGSKGYKRAPTKEELELLKSRTDGN